MVKVGQIYSIFIILGVASLSSTLYTVKNGETGKYRYYLQGHQQYRVCCYCPLEAVMYDDMIEAFQVEDCGKNITDFTEKDEFEHILYPFCSCEAKMGLTPRFIGCTLPKTSNVEWDCENGYVFPNVSVYTTCEPRCQDNNMILVKQGTESYRCNEDKQWENDPATVSCKYEEKKLDITSIIAYSCLMAVLGIIVFILFIVCWWRKWYQTYLTILKGKCNSSSDGYGVSSRDIELSTLEGKPSVTETNFQSQSTAETECSLITETSPVLVQSQRTAETECSLITKTSPVPVQNSLDKDSTLDISTANDDSVKDVEMKGEDSNRRDNIEREERSDDKERVPLLNQSCSNTDDMQIVKVNGSPEIRGDGIYYNVVLGHDVVIATNIKIEKKSDFTIDRECVVQCHVYDFLFRLKNVQKEHEGIYNWRVKESVKDQIRQGRFYLCVNDSERQDPVGADGSISIEYSSLNLNSLATIEENVVEVSGLGTCAYQNEAVLCHNRRSSSVSNQSQEEEENASVSSSRQESVSPVLTNNNQGTNSESTSTITEKCKYCTTILSEALQEHTPSQHLYNVCIMLDPKTKNESFCWKGFFKFIERN